MASVGFASRSGSDGSRRSWNARVGSGELLAVSSRASLRLAEQGPVSVELPGDYGGSWWQTLLLIQPDAYDEVATRTMDAEMNIRYANEPLGGRLAASAAWLHEIGAQRETGLTAELSAPITLRPATPRAIAVTPGYSRSLRLRGISVQDSGLLRDFGNYWDNVAGQSYVALSVPGAELFGDSLRQHFRDASQAYEEARYSARAEAELEGSAGFRPIALLLPSAATASLTRRLERDASSLQDYRDLTVRIATSAVNLFGRVGARPTFDWYETDEYRIRTAYIRSRELSAGRPAAHSSTVSLGADLRLFFGRAPADTGLQDTLSFIPKTVYSWSRGPAAETDSTLEQELETTLVWSAPNTPSWDLSLIDEPVSAVRHSEALTGTARWSLTGAESELRIVAKHTSAIHFGERGTVSAGIHLGVAREPYGTTEGNSTTFGFQTSLSGTLRF